MTQQILIKRSSVASSVPAISDIALGELAVNTNDGTLFMKKNNGTDTIVQVGGVNTVNAMGGEVVLTPSDLAYRGRTAENKLDESISVEDYLDGAESITVDAAPAFVRALAAGNPVFRSGKTYNMNAGITISIPGNRKITIEKGCTINTTNRYNSYLVNNVEWQIDGVINVTLMPDAPAVTGWPNTAAGTQNGNERGFIEFGGLESDGTPYAGFWVHGCGKIVGPWAGTPAFDDSVRQVNRKGIAAWHCNDVLVKGLDVSGFEGEAVYHRSNLAGNRNVKFLNTYVHDTKFNGLNFNTASGHEGFLMAFNFVRNSYQGIEASSGEITSNYILESTAYGIYSGDGGGGSPFYVHDNFVKNTGVTAYRIGFGVGTPISSVRVEDNWAEDSGFASFHLINVKNFTLLGNTSVRNGKTLNGYAYSFSGVDSGFVDGNKTLDQGVQSLGHMQGSYTNVRFGLNPVLSLTGGPSGTIEQYGDGSLFIGGDDAVITGYEARENMIHIHSRALGAIGAGGGLVISNGVGTRPVFAAITGAGESSDANGAIGGISFSSRKPGGTGSAVLESWRMPSSGYFLPTTDGAQNLGAPAQRINNSYFAVAPTVTSDERSKQQISLISDEVLDAWKQVDFTSFKLKDAVAVKGDNARVHFGVIAQEVKKAFDDNGLVAEDYALLCHDTWEESPAVLDEDGAEITPAVILERYGIRYEEALILTVALLKRTQSRLEKRLTDLENR